MKNKLMNCDDPLLPNYMALLASILHRKLSVAKALQLMEIVAEGSDFE